jgi:hypothetical protein
MRLRCRAVRFRGRTDASQVGAGAPAPEETPPALAPEHRRQVLFVLELVDLLAARYGFDPAALVSPRTGIPLGPELARMRKAVEGCAALACEDGRGAG